MGFHVRCAYQPHVKRAHGKRVFLAQFNVTHGKMFYTCTLCGNECYKICVVFIQTDHYLAVIVDLYTRMLHPGVVPVLKPPFLFQTRFRRLRPEQRGP